MSINVDWEWSRDLLLLLIGVLLGGFLTYLYGISITRKTLQNEAKYRAYTKMIPICKNLFQRISIVSKLSKNIDVNNTTAIKEYKKQIHVSLLSVGRRDLLIETDRFFEEDSRQITATDRGNEAIMKVVMDKIFTEIEIEIQHLMADLEQQETILLLSHPSKRVRGSLSTFRKTVAVGQVLPKVRRNISDKPRSLSTVTYAAFYYSVSITQLIFSESRGLESSLKNVIQAMQEDLEDTLSSWLWWTRVKRWWRNRN